MNNLINIQQKTQKPIEILLVEDNPGDVFLTQAAFENSKVANSVRVVEDGEAAWNYLNKLGEYNSAATPDIILLDMNLPKKTGEELLGEIKSHPVLKAIPVIILTSSKSESDVMKTYALHANGYIVKPVDLDKLIDVVKAIENFWFSVVVLPKND